MRFANFTLALSCLFLVVATEADAACFDLSKSEPHVLTGILSHRIFPGPPGFEDVRHGDTPEPGYILSLPQPICLTGDEFADPKSLFSEVQLVETDKSAKAMRSLLNRGVTVNVSQPMAAQTGHHHRPLVAWVDEISLADDVTTENGTAAAAVRAFYYALSGGNGDEASSFIVPERRRGPFSGAQMTRFYAGLAEPLELLSLQSSGSNAFSVRYKFRSNGGQCNGRAVVKTVVRSGLNLIESIQALDGC